MAVIDSGSGSAGKANVDAGFNLNVALTNDPIYVGTAICKAEIDDGSVIGTPELKTIDIDEDFKTRTATENLLDCEVFDYTAQNTGKHTYANTTMTAAWSAAGLTTNSGNITTTTTGLQVSSYAFFPLYGAAQTYCEIQGSFNALPTTNALIDFGLFLRGAANPFTPLDGIYFRLTAAGISGVINSNGTETVSGPFAFTYTANQKYQFIIQISERRVLFWINNVLYGSITTPSGQGRPCMAASLPFSIRHAIVGGAAGAALSMVVNSYTVSLGGSVFGDDLAEVGNRLHGAYTGLSGGTMGSLANYANSANPTAAVPTNTTAALGTGLGGQFWETDTLAVTTDGIICSYQVPAGTVNVQGRRLVVNGVRIYSSVQTVLTGGGYVADWSLAFGHTAVSLATAEAAAAKAPRRIALGKQTVAAAAAALALLQPIEVFFENHVYVNPGEFIAVVKKKVGTAPSAGVIAHLIMFDYGWE